MCKGYWESCKCNDCSEAKNLYSRLSWLETDAEENEKEIKEVTRKLESMGYSV